MSRRDLEDAVLRASGGRHPLDVAFATEEEDSKPWQRLSPVSTRIAGSLPESLTLVLANQIFIDKADLPQPLANRLIRLAAFQNPEFYKAQAMRLPVWNKPRIIGCAENYPQHIGLPRGCLNAVIDLLQKNDIRPELQDERLAGRKVTTKFTGTLRKDQKAAVREMLKHEVGVLYRRMPPPVGLFLRGDPQTSQGKIRGGSDRHTDTPRRSSSDHLHAVRPIRHSASRPETAPAQLEVWPKMIPAPEIPPDSPIQDVFRILANDVMRNRRIAGDLLAAYREGRKVLVLTERTDHLPLLQETLGDEVEHCFVLHGRLSKKQRTAVFAELDALDESAPRVLLATGRLIGEGFDHPPLDTLVLAMPISWKGTLQQYAGRLHREHADKQDVRIYDYAETDQPQLARMWDKRQRGYRAMGYEIKPMETVISGSDTNLK